MKRRTFIQSLALLPVVNYAMSIKELSGTLPNTEPMPVLFLGHGSPMNAVEDTEFSRGWKDAAKAIPKPRAILCVSAHWETKGTFVTAMNHPKTIHDFGGFPKELYEVQYPAPGNPLLAQETKKDVKNTIVELDNDWGLDHGCWSVVKHMYPAADVPVVQLSLDYSQTPQSHYELAKELSQLRQKGILIIGSGNIVHNLRMIDWQNENNGFDWAVEANTKVKKFISDGDHHSLINYKSIGKEFQLSVPTVEHYLPLLYVLALKKEKDTISFFNDKYAMGSLSMTCVKISYS